MLSVEFDFKCDDLYRNILSLLECSSLFFQIGVGVELTMEMRFPATEICVFHAVDGAVVAEGPGVGVPDNETEDALGIGE